MIVLFEHDQSVISRHIHNVFKERGGLALYSLDVIISVGYRVKSQRGVQFRQWATRVLKQHLVEGYSLNRKRLQEQVIEFNQVLVLLSKTLVNQQSVDRNKRTGAF